MSARQRVAPVRPPPRFFECWPKAKPDAPTSFGGKLTAHILHEDWFKWKKIEQIEFLKTEILLGITICFAQVPRAKKEDPPLSFLCAPQCSLSPPRPVFTGA